MDRRHQVPPTATIEASTDAKPERMGGSAVWMPSVMPSSGPDLSDAQALAAAFRILAHEGFSENMAGHITWQRPDETTMLVNPWGLWWDEVSGSDICTVDEDAKVVSGKWDVTPAIHIHTELHRRRSDARVVIHNHPYYICVLAALGVTPELLHQTGSLFLDDLVFVDEYAGEIDSALLAGELAEQVGKAKVAILGNHGVIVTGADIVEATYRAASFERVCRLAHDVLITGVEPRKLDRSVMVGMKSSLIERAAEVYWGGAVRSLMRRDDSFLK